MASPRSAARKALASNAGRDKLSMWDAPEVFSDNSVHLGGNRGPEAPRRQHAKLRPSLAHYPEEWVAQVANDRTAKRPKIDFNPTSGAVFIQERRRGAPWREVFEQQQELVDEKAAREQSLRRINSVAKQVSAGIKQVYGAVCDPSELAALLTQAERESKKATGGDARLVNTLKAALQFDIPRLMKLLKVDEKLNHPEPSLSITTAFDATFRLPCKR